MASAPTPPPTRATRARAFDFIDAAKAAAIDRKLMSPQYGHTLEQLMELAGLSVAHAVAQSVPDVQRTICVVCGPGNNGGDGLVAARHLFHFGYRNVCVWLPKTPTREPFVSLLTQLNALQVAVKMGHNCALHDAHVIVDAIFGFSFDGSHGIREPYKSVIDQINAVEHAQRISVDVPSGWHVDKGDVWSSCIATPHVLISLSAPKLCARLFEQRGGTHYIGGRFIPQSLCDELHFRVAAYEAQSCISRVT